MGLYLCCGCSVLVWTHLQVPVAKSSMEDLSHTTSLIREVSLEAGLANRTPSIPVCSLCAQSLRGRELKKRELGSLWNQARLSQPGKPLASAALLRVIAGIMKLPNVF